jgi:hypothetical protein
MDRQASGHESTTMWRMLRTMSWVIAATLGAFVFVACGGGVEGENTGVGGPGGPSGSGDGGEGGVHRDEAGLPIPVSEDGSTSPSPFNDPSCGDAAPPPFDTKCDVFGQTGCPSGQACYLYIDPPRGRCDQERYGGECRSVGTGTQGVACGGLTSCAPGFACMVTGAGTLCTRLCHVGRSGECAMGEVCETTDVAGLGVCF